MQKACKLCIRCDVNCRPGHEITITEKKLIHIMFASQI